VGDIQAFAVAFRCKEYVIIHFAVNHGGEVGLEGDRCRAALQLAGASVLIPVLSRLHSVSTKDTTVRSNVGT
jgi:hypothetical protein